MSDLVEALYKRMQLLEAQNMMPDLVRELTVTVKSIEQKNKKITELEAQLKELRNLREVDRVSDQSIELTFSSCRACSAFCKVIERIEEQDNE